MQINVMILNWDLAVDNGINEAKDFLFSKHLAMNTVM
jgi:hypothetical protein